MAPRRPPAHPLDAVRIGTSGFVYPHWRGCFYPRDLAQKDWLRFFAEHFETVELNNTFYRLPAPGAAQRWAQVVPAGFEFAVKGSRYLTHMRRLRDKEQGVRRFFDAIAGLGKKAGPILWQLPPQMKKDVPRLKEFLQALPRGRRYAVELRNPEWYADDLFEALDDLGAALCVHDQVEARSPFPPPGPFYYRRFHGTRARYSGRYGRAGVRHAAAEIAALASAGVRCHAYFNNDVGGAAVEDARVLRDSVAEALQARTGAPAQPF